MKKVYKKVKSYFLEDSVGCWESDVYEVYGFQDNGTLRLDIKRKDKQDGIKWEDLQQIKDDCGFSNFDAVEFYPKNKDVINTENWRHLYVFFEELPWIRRL